MLSPVSADSVEQDSFQIADRSVDETSTLRS
jgi:hypothetical protein